MEIARIELAASRMRSEHSTPELYPQKLMVCFPKISTIVPKFIISKVATLAPAPFSYNNNDENTNCECATG